MAMQLLALPEIFKAGYEKLQGGVIIWQNV